MIDLDDKEKRGRLLKAVKTSREAMLPFRRVRKELIRDYVGSWYSETGSRNKTLVNLMNQTARIYTIALAANNPQVLVTTPREMNRPFAHHFEVNLNHLISDMNMERTFRAIVLDAFFCMGCGVVMMRDTDTRFHGLLEAEEDVWLDPGEPWLNRVPLDDLILDMSARELTKMRFCGHRYRADFEKVKDEPGYDKKVKAKLTPTKRDQNETEGSARDVQTGDGWVEDDDLKDMIWLQDIWVAENNTVATMVVDQADLPPLIEREWTGSQAGPYKFLSLGDVPDNMIPASPAVNLKGMHDLQNRLHRRMEDDSDAHRTVNAYPPSGSEDAEKIRTAKRNSWVRVGDPSSINQIEVGGIDQRDMALSTFIQDEYDRMAGNLRAMAGLGAQTATVGQEELIHGSVDRTEADMRTSVVNFAADTILDLGRLMWEDEELEIQSSIPIGNTGIEVNADWLGKSIPDSRVGEFDDYQFKVEPYSMVFKTPEQKLQEIFQVLQQIAPLWPMFQASGATLDAEAIVDEIARLKNRPEFKRFITFATPADMLGGDENTAGGASHTSRENIRRNIPTGGTAEARSSAMIQSLMGGNSQVNGQMAAAMGRSPA
jgi:hypothetical protein